jgi:hypothetical protein
VAKAVIDVYCHRNTVLNRLRRIEQLTGRSLSVPKGLVDLALALEAFRQFSHSAEGGRPVEQDAAIGCVEHR